MRFSRTAAATLLAAGALSACSSRSGATPQSTPAVPASSTSTSTSTSPSPTTSVPSTTSLPPTTSAPITSAPPTSAPPKATTLALPRGGTKILGHYRVVAYYGGPDGPALGVLGSEPPEQIAGDIEARAHQWAGHGLTVQPAMELIATVAQGAPGPDGLYSAAIDDAKVQHYLDVAHHNKMLLILDFQPGQGQFLPQVEHFAKFLRDPSVSVALDPEWKMPPGVKPGTIIGSSTSPDILAVRNYLAGVVAQHHLPDKLLMLHEFRLSMLPDRQRITPAKGIEIVFHADGFGSRSAKNATWDGLDFPGRPYGTGFKLFLRQDLDIMGPDQVLDRHPVPDVITYQ